MVTDYDIVTVMGKYIDLTSQVFGRLTVLERAQTRRLKPDWMCRCECGTEKPVNGSDLRGGKIKSCGCLQKEKVGALKYTHGLSQGSEYNIWSCMKRRCENANHPRYKRYGGRGIKVCDRWAASFENFYADMGPRPGLDLSLDRIENDGDYCPENCRWTDAKTQYYNTDPELREKARVRARSSSNGQYVCAKHINPVVI